MILTRRDARDTPLYVNGRNVSAVEPDEFDTAVVYTPAGTWRVLERFEWITWNLGTRFDGEPERFSQDNPYPEATGPEAVRPRPVAYDFTEAERLADEMRLAIGRHDPLPGDLVEWHDGTWGVVAIVDAPWLEPGEAVVYRHEDQAHGGAPSWRVEAGSLVACFAHPDGRQVFTYRGSLR